VSSAGLSDASAPEFLATIDAIDAAWLDRVFHSAGVRTTPVAAVRREPIGFGTTSQVQRLSLAFAGPRGEAPATVVAKFPNPLAPGASPDPGVAAGYLREVAAYAHLGRATPFRVPGCYWAECRDDGAFNLILEDLGEGCRPGDQIAGCSIAEARAVVRELAELHGAALGASTLAGLPWLRRPAATADRAAARYRTGAGVMRARFADRLGAEAMAALDGAAELIAPWVAAPLSIEAMIHSDPRVDNIIFEGPEAAPRACLIDLQFLAVGEPAFDLAYFLTGSLEPAERAACEHELVLGHAAHLRSRGADYDDATAWRVYRENAIAGLLGTVGAAAILADAMGVDELLFALARRNCAAVIELDGLSALERRLSLV
jgi:aminoglycoside phosphotransferase (APT) family kinase protein